jgi:hypothetical protein
MKNEINMLSFLEYRLKQVKLQQKSITDWVFPVGDTRQIQVKYNSKFLVDWLKIQIRAFSRLEAEAIRIRTEQNRLIAFLYVNV